MASPHVASMAFCLVCPACPASSQACPLAYIVVYVILAVRHYSICNYYIVFIIYVILMLSIRRRG